MVVGWGAVAALRGTPLHPVAGVVLNDGVLAPVPPDPGVEVQYPGRVLAVDGAQALQLDHELRDEDGAVSLAHPRELRHVLLVRGAWRGDDGDGGPGGEAAGEEDDPATRAHGHRGGALVGGGARGVRGREIPRVPRERGGLVPRGEAEHPRVVGHAVERRAVARREGRQGDAVVAVPEGAHGDGGGGGRVGGREVVGGGRGGEGGGAAIEVGRGEVEDVAELEGDEEEVGQPRREDQVRRPHPPRHCPPRPSSATARTVGLLRGNGGESSAGSPAGGMERAPDLASRRGGDRRWWWCAREGPYGRGGNGTGNGRRGRASVLVAARVVSCEATDRPVSEKQNLTGRPAGAARGRDWPINSPPPPPNFPEHLN
jgi:hypothetical protein